MYRNRNWRLWVKCTIGAIAYHKGNVTMATEVVTQSIKWSCENQTNLEKISYVSKVMDTTFCNMGDSIGLGYCEAKIFLKETPLWIFAQYRLGTFRDTGLITNWHFVSFLFTFYIRDIISCINDCGIGCNVRGMFGLCRRYGFACTIHGLLCRVRWTCYRLLHTRWICHSTRRRLSAWCLDLNASAL